MRWLWIIAIVVCAAILVVTGQRAVAARSKLSDARITLATFTQQGQELIELRARAAETILPEKPVGGLAPRVSAALARAGLASSVLQVLSPEAENPLQGSRAIRQRATVTLVNLSLPQLGLFLSTWRTSEPDWVISGIDLSPLQGGRHDAIGTDLPLRAVLTLEGFFKDVPKGVTR